MPSRAAKATVGTSRFCSDRVGARRGFWAGQWSDQHAGWCVEVVEMEQHWGSYCGVHRRDDGGQGQQKVSSSVLWSPICAVLSHASLFAWGFLITSCPQLLHWDKSLLSPQTLTQMLPQGLSMELPSHWLSLTWIVLSRLICFPSCLQPLCKSSSCVFASCISIVWPTVVAC